MKKFDDVSDEYEEYEIQEESAEIPEDFHEEERGNFRVRGDKNKSH